MPVQPGQSANPKGRPPGPSRSGESIGLVIDRMLKRRSNRKILAQALEQAFREDPLRFLKTVVPRFLPKDGKMPVEKDRLPAGVRPAPSAIVLPRRPGEPE